MTDITNYNPSLKTDSWELLQVANALGINERSFKLLLEAYRRKNLSNSKSQVHGFGTPSKYKDKFFKAVDKTKALPHQNTNWMLTPKGKEVLAIIENIVKIPKNQDVKEHLSRTIMKLEVCA